MAIKSCILLSLSALAAASAVHRKTRQSAITEDSYFYGQSPPVYPSPRMDPQLDPWAEAYAKAQALVGQMTIEEKANITVGRTPNNRCSGVTGSVPRLAWPGICMTGAGNGIRQTDFMGGETKAKGLNLLGGPVMGPLGRMARHGRNWEGFSSDPYLSGQLSALTVKGIQDRGVMAMSKHFVGYEQQTHRMPVVNADGTTAMESYSSNVGDRAMHELYLWPFADSIRAGTTCIMCSYNRLNNSHACQNSKALNGLLKTELGFQGWVVSDWYAQHAGVATAEAGLDVAMPVSSRFWGAGGVNLTQAVENGTLPEARLTDMVSRLLTAWYLLEQDEDRAKLGEGMPIDFTVPHKPIYAKDPASKPILLNGAIEGHVLVKNANKSLPLSKPKMISIFGYDAPAPQVMDVPANTLQAVAANGWIYGTESVNITNFNNVLYGNYSQIPGIAPLGTLITGGGSGATAPSYISNNTALFWDFRSTNPEIDTATDACLVFVNAYGSEGMDRPHLRDDYSDSLIMNVASKCDNTIVTIHNAGIRLVDQWIDHPNITAVLLAHLPGQDSGRAVVSVLYGHVSPSGKLPYTLAKNESDYEPFLNPTNITDDPMFAKFPQNNFTDSIYIDYRHFDKNGIEPRYEFGFGLTYTTFEYSGLDIKAMSNASYSRLPPMRPTGTGGNPALWDVLARVSATVTNTGDIEAAEIAQLYVGIPGDDVPMRQLRGFDKRIINIGGQVNMAFELTRRDLSVWDVVEQDWVLRSGEYKIYVGSSSRDLPLESTLII
ncbi:glycoside hydrolase family 3 protein [Zopfia rhizophila CBS 207.26]|uniref:beta-glucosidase n=1 Tax=Zopfia rhizophila CBS 207.26 TaxID=1314779 RepID=A0A6A6DBE3_9PEZI|nr:glycoside hydrolase family 3 protein [Zopfia rhizophila CBS 207.26]